MVGGWTDGWTIEWGLVNNEWVPHGVLLGICQCDLKGCFASVPGHCSLIATEAFVKSSSKLTNIFEPLAITIAIAGLEKP